MLAQELIIENKVKANLFDIVALSDFDYSLGQELDASVILQQTNISLYCLDPESNSVVFVEKKPEVDLLNAPFYFIAQYEAAQRLITISYERLFSLASEVTIETSKVILFYSTGRCGSTLFSHILNLNPKVISFAEPDVFSQLVMLRTKVESSKEEISSLLLGVTKIMCATAKLQGYDYYAFKFRSYVLSVSDLLFYTIPEAKILFMYRNALTWAQSFSRAFGPTEDEFKKRLQETGTFRYVIPSVNSHLLKHNNQMTWNEYLAHMWVSTMKDALWLKEHSSPLATASFEALKASPSSVIETLLSHCDLPLPHTEGLAEILAKDSQAGTQAAQDNTEVTEDDLIDLENIILQMEPYLLPDTQL